MESRSELQPHRTRPPPPADVHRATPEQFDAIHGVLQEFGGGLSRDDWRRIIDYRFGDQDYRGWVSVVGGEVVGFLGAIFSRRGDERFCSLTSWITKRTHRKANLNILAPMLSLTDHTLLNFSASAFTATLFTQRLGFEVLDRHLQLIPAVTPRLPVRGWTRIRRPQELEQVLTPEQWDIYRDHLPYAARHVVLTGPKGHLYVVASRTTLRRMPVAFVHYVSDPALFAELVNPVQRALFADHHTLVTAIDERLLAGQAVRGALRWRLAQPRLYRPAKTRPTPPRVIDSLYTELVMLNPAQWTFNH